MKQLFLISFPIPLIKKLLFGLLLNVTIFRVSAQIPSDGLVAFYPFVQNARDHSNYGNDGIVYNAVAATDRFGMLERCLYFNGIDAYIAIPSSASLNPTDQLTINLWIKIGALDNRYIPILHKGGTFETDFTNREYVIFLADFVSIYAESSGDNMVRRFLNCYFPEGGDWFMYSIVIDRVNHEMKNYINGLRVSSIPDSYSSFTNNSDSLKIATWEETHASYGEFFNGYLDDLRIYNRALDSSDIEKLFNEPNDLISHYPFNGDASDKVGVNHGTINGALPVPDRFGKDSSAYYFDGVNDYIDCGKDKSLDLTGDLSISLWVNYNGYEEGNSTFPGILSKASENEGSESHLWGGYFIGSYMDYPSESQNGNLRSLVLGPDIFSEIASEKRYDDSTWHNIILTYKSATCLKLFVDNELTAESDENILPEIGITDKSLSIGRHYANNIYQYFRGSIDDIRIYDKVLTAGEMTELYYEGKVVVIEYDTVTVYDTIPVFDTIAVYDTIQVFDTTTIILYDSISVTDTLIIELIIDGVNSTMLTNRITVYPNPSHNILYIDAGDYSLIQGYMVKILNAIGQAVIIFEINQKITEVEVTELGGRGLYILQLMDETYQIREVRKILIE